MNKNILISDILSKIPNDYKYKVINFASSILETNIKGRLISFIDKTKTETEKVNYLKAT